MSPSESNPTADRHLPLWCSLTVPGIVIVLDQLTKWWTVVAFPREGEHRPVIEGFFHLVHFRNPGAAWGVFSGHTHVLSVISVVVLIGGAYWYRSLGEGDPRREFALAAVGGGIVGNLIDRVFHGEVIDFLFFFYRGYHWPAFNVADMAITCGVAAFIIFSFLSPSPSSPPEESAS